MTKCVCVLEDFNCMLLDDWILVDTRIVNPRILNVFRIAFYFALQ